MTSIYKLLKARAQAFEKYDEFRAYAFETANQRDEAKRALDIADRAIQNFLRSTLPS